MKAVILNSGIGKRMGAFTLTNHKSMVLLKNQETVFHRQIRLLSECGIKEFVVTTGAFQAQLVEEANKKEFSLLKFTFVHNPRYAETNYIYSMHLAAKYLDDEILLLHGDLVFSRRLAKVMLKSKKSTCLINTKKTLPAKDFKGRVQKGLLKEVGINIFDTDCYAFQPFYHLLRNDINSWMARIADFVKDNNVNVYAENALNTISESVKITAIDYSNHYIDEIDNLEDLARVSQEIIPYDYQEQIVYDKKDSYQKISSILERHNSKRPFIVCSEFFHKTIIKKYLDTLNIKPIFFTEFDANPKYEEVLEGVKSFKKNDCDFLISCGGGSAIDIAKAIKLFLPLDNTSNYLKQATKYCSIKHLAIPTTAGTGSESTRFAVVYFQNAKQSLNHEMLIPEYIILEPSLLETLSTYQKQATMLDAMTQAMESYYSLKATKESRKDAESAIELILANYKKYLTSYNESATKNMLLAANFSGRAINISETTAAHAMSYKLTSLYGYAHGHAVALCFAPIFSYMLDFLKKKPQPSGLDVIFARLAKILGVKSAGEIPGMILKICEDFKLKRPKINDVDLNDLVKSVNQARLKNNPVVLEDIIIRKIYQDISL